MAIRTTNPWIDADLGPTGGTLAPLRPGERILVPLVRGQSAASLLRLGDAIAQRCTSHGVVLSLVEIPSRWNGLVPSAVARSRELLRWIASNDYAADVESSRMSIRSRLTSDPASTIHELVFEADCDLVLAEWPSAGSRREHRLQAMLASLVRDRQRGLVVVRPDPAAAASAISPRTVLAALRGGPNARLALSVASALAAHAGAELTLLHVYDTRLHREHRRYEEAVFHELACAATQANPRVLELFGDDPAEVLLKEARRYDAVVLGAHANPNRDGILIGAEMSTVMDALPMTVIVTRAADGTSNAA